MFNLLNNPLSHSDANKFRLNKDPHEILHEYAEVFENDYHDQFATNMTTETNTEPKRLRAAKLSRREKDVILLVVDSFSKSFRKRT